MVVVGLCPAISDLDTWFLFLIPKSSPLRLSKSFVYVV